MAPEEESIQVPEHVKSVVVVSFPGGKELLWVAPDSPVASWQVGDDVVFRSGRWRVTGRAFDSDALRFTLGRIS